jgi:two-component system response regulator CpxR
LAILDDDIELGELLTAFLTGEGYGVRVFHEPEALLKEDLEASFDLLILDVMLPGMNGFDVLRQVRDRSGLPVIMLTARGEELDRILGLELGADDYLAKPFNPRELAARIRAVSRRYGPASPNPREDREEELVVGDVHLLPGTRRVFRHAEEIHLTAVEFKLLERLLRSAGTVIKRQDLALQVLDRTLSYEDRSLDVHVSNLRRKLGNSTPLGERIQTIRGMGYVYARFPVETEA